MRILLSLLLVLPTLSLFAQGRISVLADQNGRLVTPTNFFEANRLQIAKPFTNAFISVESGIGTNTTLLGPKLYTPYLYGGNFTPNPDDRVVLSLEPDANMFVSDSLKVKDLLLATGNLTNWAKLPTNVISSGGGGGGTVTSVGIDSSTLTVSGSPVTNSGTITVEVPASYTTDTELNSASNAIIASIASSNYVTSVALASSNYVTASITNGLAGTNLIYRILPGTNMVAVTNGWDVTLSSTASGGGGTITTNFDSVNITNSIFTPYNGANPRWNIWRQSGDNELYFDRHHSGSGYTRLNVRDIPYTTTNLIMRFDGTSKKISIFNSFTDASNYEEGYLRWETNVFKLGTASAGTGTKRNMSINVPGNTATWMIDVNPSETFNSYSGVIKMRNTGNGTTIGFCRGCGDTTGFFALVGSGITYYSASIYHDNGAMIIPPGGNAMIYSKNILLLNTSVGFTHTNTIISWRSHCAYNNIVSTNFSFMSFGAPDAYHPALSTTNLNLSFTTGNDVNCTNPVVVIAPIQRTNWIGGNTTITNLISVGVNGQTGKSVTNTWYSVGSDGTGVVTNRQVYLNGILVSWQVNGSEL